MFLAWEPHPMNMRFDIKYLAGGDPVFGPNSAARPLHGDAQGYAGVPERRPVARELKFTLRGESEMMAATGPA